MHTLEDLEARATTVSAGEAARRIGWKASTLANARWKGSGPPYLKIGGRVRYRLCDIADWLDSQTRASTSDAAPMSSQQEATSRDADSRLPSLSPVPRPVHHPRTRES